MFFEYCNDSMHCQQKLGTRNAFFVTERIRERFSEKVTKSHFWRMSNNFTNNGGTGWQKKRKEHMQEELRLAYSVMWLKLMLERETEAD